MFPLPRYICNRLLKKLRNRVEITRSIAAVGDSRNDGENATKVSPSDRFWRFNDYDNGSCSVKAGDIKVAIIGGGMAPIYAALLLKQSRLIKRVNIADPKDTLAGAVFDAGHIDTTARIKYYSKQCIPEALIDVRCI